MPKPGNYARRMAAELRWDLIRHNWQLVSLLALAGLVISAGVTALTSILFNSQAASFAAGVFLTASIWLAWDLIDRESGARSYAAGAGGEALTATALNRLQRCQVLHGLKFYGFDIDHVVISSGGIAAVETKWTARKVDVSSTSNDRQFGEDLQDATRGANKISLYLRRSAKLEKVEVQPVLIMWGAGLEDLPGGRTNVDGVEVLIGRQAKEWRSTFLTGNQLDEWTQRASLEALSIREQVQI
jgi:hypothetical protein